MSPLNGSKLIYDTLILPRFEANESTIDQGMNQLKKITGQIGEEAMKVAQETRKDL